MVAASRLDIVRAVIQRASSAPWEGSREGGLGWAVCPLSARGGRVENTESVRSSESTARTVAGMMASGICPPW